ncbi:hypothetical protein GGQ64_002601 [Rhizobium azooxidifex]|uniref:Uncharacterized protein n=1 Tax=Mycoplana azooxidifex TaxID=1636188 RepID=A0A7W6D600_9HYPH|nr:hypothetical protein [Mycoplana azooxidifex]MBB3977395.1 hypothetical protein [Mycoplana azooxidifex]
MAGISSYGWQAALDALQLAINGISGIREQPRCAGKNSRQYNAAGEYLEDLQGILNREVERLIAAATSDQCDEEEWQHRAQIRIQVAARDNELNLLEMADFALRLHKEGRNRLSAEEGSEC